MPLLLVALVAASCGQTQQEGSKSSGSAQSAPAAAPASPAPAPAPAPKPLTKLKMGVVLSGSILPIMVAQDKGYFKQEGLDVEVITFQRGGDATQAVATGAVELGGYSVSSTLAFFEKGIKLKNFVLLQERPITAIVTRKDLNIPSGDFKALAGKTIGVSGPGGATDILLRVILKQKGMDPDRDVVITSVGALDGQLAALKAKQVDAIVTWEPLASRLILANALNLGDMFLDMRLPGAPHPLNQMVQSAVAAKAEWVAANRQTALGVARAIAKANHDLRADPKLVAKTYEQAFPGLTPDIYQSIGEKEGGVFASVVTREHIRVLNEVGKSTGELKGDVKWEDVMPEGFEDAWLGK